uniref:Uncharacterized protein n=1 Tax=Picea sitchensis TaxID=3332 RepID=D5ABT3_PICSI|nr:unknown [Picea sitchensis]
MALGIHPSFFLHLNIFDFVLQHPALSFSLVFFVFLLHISLCEDNMRFYSVHVRCCFV